MRNFLISFGLLVTGLVLQRFRDFPATSAKTLNLFVIHVPLPALILVQIWRLPETSGIGIVIAMPWLMLAASAGLIALLARLFSWPRQVVGALFLMIPLGNTSFLGIPMVTAFFGDQGVPYAVLYDQLGSFLALSTYGAMILAAFSGQARPDARAMLTKVVTFPPFIALLLALATKPLDPPPILHEVLSAIAASLVPVVMVAVGLQMRLRFAPGSFAPFGFGLLVKLVAAPLLALAVIKISGIDSEAARVAVFEAGMPPMVTAGAMASVAGLAPELCAALVGYGILASFVTLPVLFQLF